MFFFAGASGNLGIRSPNSQGIPVLQSAGDFSPSPPFVAADTQRRRMPTPQSHAKQVRHTAMIHSSPPVRDAPYTDPQTIYQSNVSRKRQQSHYEKIVDDVPKAHKSANSNTRKSVAINEGYPISNEDDDINNYKTHTYYKPGAYSSRIAQTLFNRRKKSSKTESPNTRSRNQYRRVPLSESTCDDEEEDEIFVRTEKPKTVRNNKLSVCSTKDNEIIEMGCIPKSKIDKFSNPQLPIYERKRYSIDSPPAASSSRNTSIDVNDEAKSKINSRFNSRRENEVSVERVSRVQKKKGYENQNLVYKRAKDAVIQVSLYFHFRIHRSCEYPIEILISCTDFILSCPI